MIVAPTPPARQASPRRSLLLLALVGLLLSGCAGPRAPGDPPPDLPEARNAHVVNGDDFRIWIASGCLSGAEAQLLLNELQTARGKLLARLGSARFPGDFRSPDGPRRKYRPQAAPLAVPDPIEVVVVPDKGRCHADAEGITLRAEHLNRRDGTHELVHYLAGSSWRPLDEGLAVYLTEELWGARRGFTSKIRARVYLDLNLARPLRPQELRKGMSRIDYDTAGAFVRWLIEARGRERFWELYHGPTGDYHTVYGQAEVELWEEFWRYIGNLDVRRKSAYYAYKVLLQD